MTTMRWLVLLTVTLPLLLAGCKTEEAKTPESKQYPIKGKVMSLDAKKPSVKLDHEDIPGLMKGMQMTFDVADAKLLDGLKEGDDVQGQLKVEAGKYIITELKKR
jgi:protein SCO1/2